MLTEPFVILCDAGDSTWTLVGVEADDDDDTEDDTIAVTVSAEAGRSVSIERRLTLASDDAAFVRKFSTDPRGPPARLLSA